MPCLAIQFHIQKKKVFFFSSLKHFQFIALPLSIALSRSVVTQQLLRNKMNKKGKKMEFQATDHDYGRQ